jgi:signal transduction histidine kinase/ligand-binding sensor domain-containing protein
MKSGCAFVAACALLGSPRSAAALDPHRALDQYIHDAWTSEDGLPQNSVRAIAQTKDGYLWLGTEEGLVRFDGVRFEVFDKTNTASITTSLVNVLAADQSGALWIGFQSPGLCRLERGRVACVGRELGVIDALAFSADGVGWIGTPKGIVRLERGVLHPVPGLASHRVRFISPLPDGRMLLVNERELLAARTDEVEPYTLPPGLTEGLRAFLVDRDGTPWAGTLRNAYRYFGSRWERMTPTGSPHGEDRVMSLFEDAEGSVWIGSGFSGIHRLREGRFVPFGAGQGLRDEHVRSIFANAAGEVFAGAESGDLLRLTGGVFRAVHPGWPNDTVWCIAQDDHRGLWIGTYGGADRLDGDSIEHFAIEGGVISLASAGGVTYLGTVSRGLGIFEGGALRFVTDGLPRGPISSLYFRERTRELWIGAEQGLFILRDGRIVDRSSAIGSAIYAFHETEDGAMWIGTRDAGLFRELEGTIAHAGAREGLFNDSVFTLLEDKERRFWMSCDKGVFSVARSDLEALFRKEKRAIGSNSYGVLDGMPSQECNGPPGGARAPDGRMWFPTIRGLAVIEPDRKPRALPAPSVIIEALIAGDEPIPLQMEAVIEPGRDRLEIRYTAPSFVAPSRVRFRYRLDPVDADWIDAGARRSAFYTNLAPGPYRFAVSAMNADGVWSEDPAAIALRLQPRFFQTRWFKGALLIAAMALAYSGYRWRVRRLEWQRLHLLGLVEARTKDLAERNLALDGALASLREAQSDLVRAERMASVAALVQGIAHELNNPLGFIQGNMDVLRRYTEFLARVATDLSDGRARTKEEIAELARISPKKDLELVVRDLGKVIDDVREGARRASLIVSDLQSLTRPSQRALEEVDLAELAARAVRLMSGRLGVGMRIEVDAPIGRAIIVARAGELDQVMVNLLDNAVRALSQVGCVKVAVRREDQDISVLVKDDGCGMSEEVRARAMEPFFTTRSAGEGSGLGLSIVARIVKGHHGRIALTSEPGGGTRVELRFPIDAGKPA